MAEIVFAEILDRSGRVRNRVRMETFPFKIGRGYDNDLILNDRFVDSNHVMIDRREDGKLWAVDMGSKNGLFKLFPSEKISEVDIQSDLSLRLGQTVIRIRTSAFQVTPTEAINEKDWGYVLSRPILVSSVFIMTALTIFINEYFKSYGNGPVNRFIGNVMMTFMFIGLLIFFWSGVWAFVGRLLTQKFYFLGHCMIASMVFLGLKFFNVVSSYAEFSFALRDWSAITIFVVYAAALGFGLFYGHLHLSTIMSTRKAASISAMIVLIGGGFVAGALCVSSMSFEDAPHFYEDLKPPVFRISRPKSIDEFLNSGIDLRGRVEKLAKR